MSRPTVTGARFAVIATGDVGEEMLPVATANPLPVAIVGGSSAGTEYVEDAAAAANPSGGALILIRRDTLSASEVSADGDNVAAKATSKGQLHIRAIDLEALLPAALAAGGGLKVEGVAGGVAQPVSGTFWQATQPVSGTFWQATQPVSAASLPLPTGAASETTLAAASAKLPATLAAGGGLKVEGVAGGVAQPVSGTFWQATQPVSAASLPLPTGAASETTLAAASAKLPAALAAGGGMKVEGVAGGVAQPVSAASLPLPIGAATETTLAAASAKLPASLGTKAASASLSVTQAGLEYETVAASSTAQALGATGATGDYLSHIIIQPATTAAGPVTVLDNATVIYTFTAGTLADLRPIIVPFNLFSVSGAWKVTTGTNVAVTGIGDFT